MKNKTILTLFVLCCMLSVNLDCAIARAASPKKGKARQTSEQPAKKSESAYEKVFKDKKEIKTEHGLMDIHLVDGKYYIELPLSLLGRDMAINSFVEESSDTQLAYIGRKVSPSTNVIFGRTDSLVTLSKPDYTYLSGPNSGITQALDDSSIGAILFTAPIISLSPDGSALLFDATDLLISDNRIIASLAGSIGMGSVTTTFKKDKSFPSGISAGADNVSFISALSYEYKINIMGFESANSEMLTAKIRTVFSLLPENPARPRAADPRLGTALTAALVFPDAMEASRSKYFARRWKVEPADPDALSRGQISGITEQIVFHIDTLFPPLWQRAIVEGVEKWNKAFERIGYKEVLIAKPYPYEDPHFSANDIGYNCIKYVQNTGRGVDATMVTDPRSGEILGASIYFARDAALMMQRDMLIQIGAVDSNVRHPQLPDHLISKAITAHIMHAVGTCFGFTTNNAGTAAYGVEELRDPAFTKKNGFTSTVMSPVKYNYAAQPGDPERGVVMVSEDLGPYDYFAVKWLYSPMDPYMTQEQEFTVIDGWIKEKEGDPRFLFKAAQPYQFALDPRAAGLLGNDMLASARYALKNSRYIVDNGFDWIDTPDIDESYRSLFVDFVFLDVMKHFQSIPMMLGGIYTNDRYEGDAAPSYRFVPREEQKKALNFILNESSDMSWMNNRPMMFAGGMGGNMPEYTEIFVNRYLFARLQTLAFGLGSDKKGTPYPYAEIISDIGNHVLSFVSSGARLPSGEKSRLDQFVEHLMKNAPVRPKTKKEASASAVAFSGITSEEITTPVFDPLYAELMTESTVTDEVFAFTPMSSLKYFSRDNHESVNFHLLKKTLQSLKTGASRTKDKDQKDHYDYLTLKITKFLSGD